MRIQIAIILKDADVIVVIVADVALASIIN